MAEGSKEKQTVEEKLKVAKERKEKLLKKKEETRSRASTNSGAAADEPPKELPKPPGRPVAVPLGLTPRFPLDDAESKGVEEQRAEGAFYITGPEGGNEVGVVLFPDLWGWSSGRTRAVADFLAGMLNAVVVVPRLLDSPPMDGGTNGDGLPPDFDVEARQDDLRAWLLKHSWDVLEPKVRAALVRLRSAGVKRIAGVAVGSGAWALCLASAANAGEFMCGALVHPTIHTQQELHTRLRDDTEQDRARKLRQIVDKVPGPYLVLTAGDAPARYLPGGEVFEALSERPHGTTVYPGEEPPAMAESAPFPDMAVNWLDRGDVADPAVRAGAVKAMHVMEKYLRRRMWPLEQGSDAGRLRLLAREGGAEDRMAEVLRFGVPAGGEDSADKQGLEPIHYAARNAHIVEVSLLVEWKASVNATGGASGESPLHLAVGKKELKFLSQLLKMRADPEVRDKAGQTPLHHAARLGQPRLINILLSGKAQIDALDTARQTPMHFAAWNGKAAAVRMLLDARMNVEPRDMRVATPAFRAEQHNWGAVAILLNEEKSNRIANGETAEFADDDRVDDMPDP